MRCPCFYPEIDPDSYVEGDGEYCACGHAPDEHDEDGQCQVDLPGWAPPAMRIDRTP